MNWEWINNVIDENPVFQYIKDPTKTVRIIQRRSRTVTVDHGAYQHDYSTVTFVDLYEPCEVTHD